MEDEKGHFRRARRAQIKARTRARRLAFIEATPQGPIGHLDPTFVPL